MDGRRYDCYCCAAVQNASMPPENHCHLHTWKFEVQRTWDCKAQGNRRNKKERNPETEPPPSSSQKSSQSPKTNCWHPWFERFLRRSHRFSSPPSASPLLVATLVRCRAVKSLPPSHETHVGLSLPYYPDTTEKQPCCAHCTPQENRNLVKNASTGRPGLCGNPKNMKTECGDAEKLLLNASHLGQELTAVPRSHAATAIEGEAVARLNFIWAELIFMATVGKLYGDVFRYDVVIHPRALYFGFLILPASYHWNRSEIRESRHARFCLKGDKTDGTK